jgi:hypothetical protein
VTETYGAVDYKDPNTPDIKIGKYTSTNGVEMLTPN